MSPAKHVLSKSEGTPRRQVRRSLECCILNFASLRLGGKEFLEVVLSNCPTEQSINITASPYTAGKLSGG